MYPFSAKYLDPKNDLTFRKIFGEHPHLLISFLNSMLPLEPGQVIESVVYTNNEIIPELPGFKRSIVDVNCTDNHGRMFIVEMQMYWTSSFKQRMLFNAGKAYVRQLKHGGKYRTLRPVYGLSLVDDIFHREEELKDTFYHHYRMAHADDNSKQIEGIELIFIELPKFQARNYNDKRMQTLWLRFLTEINEETENVEEDLMEESLIREALECVSKDAFTVGELEHYDKYWDAIRVEKAAIEELSEKNAALEEKAKEVARQVKESTRQAQEAAFREKEAARQAQESARREQEAKELAEQERQKKHLAQEKLGRILLRQGMTPEEVSMETGLDIDSIKRLL